MNSFDMLNALVSLCDKRSTEQDALYQLGYKSKDIRLEYPAGITGGKGVVVDLLLLSEAINSVLCIESKSGRNIELAQARGYRKLKPQQFAALIRKWREPGAFSVDVAYVCTTAQLEPISKGLKRENLDHSIICFHEVENGQLLAAERYPHLRLALEMMARPCLITLERNKLKNQRLASRLSRGIALDLATVPPFIHFDVSSTAAHLTRCLLQAVSGFAAEGRSTFSSEELASAAYGAEAWQKTMRRAELLARVNKTLTAAADDAGLSRYLAPIPGLERQPAKLRWRISGALVDDEVWLPPAQALAAVAEFANKQVGSDAVLLSTGLMLLYVPTTQPSCPRQNIAPSSVAGGSSAH